MSKINKVLTGASLAPFVLVAFSLPAAAQTPRTGVPDSWVGTWAAAGKDMPSDMKVEVTRNFDPKLPDLLYGQLSKMIIDHMKPWAVAEMQDTDWDLDDAGQVCKLTGIFRQGSAGGGGFTLLQEPGKIFLVTNVDEVGARRVYFNSPHPEGLLPTYNGDSRAHWDGDVLVIDTIGFNDKTWLDSDREVHTGELHVVERLRPEEYKGATYVELRVFVDDRKALKSPYTFTRVIRKGPAPAMPAAGGAAAAAGGRGGGGGGGVCNESEGKMLWQKHREELLDQREKDFQDFIAKVSSQK